jgi:hypothetical protein
MIYPNLPTDYTPAPLECRPTGGFSTRLRILASAAWWVVCSINTTVQILWLNELNIFAAPSAIVFDVAALPYWFQIHDAPFLPHSGWLTARQILSTDDMAFYVNLMQTKPIRIVAGVQFATTDTTFWECLTMFKPAASIVEAINTAFGQIIGRTLIGVHYRKGTATQSPAAAFWAAMTVAIDANPGVLFYIASDDPGFVESARLLFPGHTTVGFTQPKDANNPEGNEQAAIDFFALAQTTQIFGSIGSGFGQLAAYYGGISYVEILA